MPSSVGMRPVKSHSERSLQHSHDPAFQVVENKTKPACMFKYLNKYADSVCTHVRRTERNTQHLYVHCMQQHVEYTIR